MWTISIAKHVVKRFFTPVTTAVWVHLFFSFYLQYFSHFRRLYTQLNRFLQLNLFKSSVQLDSFTNWTRSVSRYPSKLPSGPTSKGTRSISLRHRHFTKERAPELTSSEDGSRSSQPSLRIEVVLSPPLWNESEAQWATFHKKQKREESCLTVY